MTKLLDEDGENLAVRSFLLMYGAQSVTIGQMRRHLMLSGFTDCWPEWVNTVEGHLTKSGAQDWLRYLFKLEVSVTCGNTGLWVPDRLETA